MKTIKLVMIGMLSSMSLALMWVGFPIIPIAPYLKYEPSDIPLMIASMMYGPLTGLIALVIKNSLYFFVHGGNIFGIFMNFCASGTFLLMMSLFYKKTNIFVSAGIGTIAMALITIPLNVIIVPLEFGMDVKKVWAMILPVYIPFNLVKGSLNTILFILVWSQIKKRVYSSSLADRKLLKSEGDAFES
jgi:riboflavin transporter